MPNYEYQCTACNHIFEIWQPVGEAAPACPECGSAVKKVFHPPRVIFKGSGFYVTDLRAEKAASGGGSSSGARKTESTDKTPNSSEASSSESSGEAKSGEKSSDATAKTEGSALSTSTPSASTSSAKTSSNSPSSDKK